MRTIALIGEKLSHSFSKGYFTQKFKEQGIGNYEYINIELSNLDGFKEFIIKNENIIGFNVTIPYKESVISILDELDETARIVGAVNTVKVKRTENKVVLKGYNTDAYGFQFSIKPFLNMSHQKALILGTGGASKAVASVFKKLGIEYVFASRTIKNNNTLSYSDINEFAINHFKLIVNCTPLGMYPNTSAKLPIPTQAITNEHLCVDLIYNPEETEFLKVAKEKGAIALNGLSMLHLQADKAWEIFIEK
jgi:shikimate dehydrogenase